MTERRHSVSEEASSEHDPVRRAELEAKNGLRQFDYGMQLVEDALSRGGEFRLRVSHIQGLHREALVGISPYAGNWRPASIAIQGSRHEPLAAHLVAENMEDLCDYINARWDTATPIHLSAYAMWRLNWIHPFTDGNGRTSRIVSYIVMCIGLKSILRGKNTIPDQIVDNRQPYFDALEKADQSVRDGILNLSAMENLLERMLAAQLVDMVETATGKSVSQ